jgi:hypothetical protein
MSRMQSRTLSPGRRRAAREGREEPRLMLAIGTLTCPRCGLRIRDSISARAGYCDQCQDFTRMCGAGRQVVSPDVMFRTSWHSPCTTMGEVPWEIAADSDPFYVLLCLRHDAGLTAGEAPWLRRAVRLQEPPDQRVSP